MPATVHEYDLPEHDYPQPTEPRLFYVLCTTPRSGSTLLSQGLWRAGVAGRPHEYFNQVHTGLLMERWGVSDFDTYLAQLLRTRTGPNGVFGFKLHAFQRRQYWSDRDLEAVFPGARYVYIRRLDHVRQAVSWARADQTNAWAAGIPALREPRYDREMITSMLREVESEEEDWEEFFAARRISPLRVVYEEFVVSYAATVLAVLRYIGIEAGATMGPPPLARQADALSESWVRRYLEAAA